MTPAELIAVTFLLFSRGPACTIALPQGVKIEGMTCPKNDLANDNGLTDNPLGKGLIRCVRRYSL